MLWTSEVAAAAPRIPARRLGATAPPMCTEVTMRLLHRLQQLGTVGAIDYEAYAGPLTYGA